jgi:hypothetical protein
MKFLSEMTDIEKYNMVRNARILMEQEDIVPNESVDGMPGIANELMSNTASEFDERLSYDAGDNMSMDDKTDLLNAIDKFILDMNENKRFISTNEYNMYMHTYNTMYSFISDGTVYSYYDVDSLSDVSKILLDLLKPDISNYMHKWILFISNGIDFKLDHMDNMLSIVNNIPHDDYRIILAINVDILPAGVLPVDYIKNVLSKNIRD